MMTKEMIDSAMKDYAKGAKEVYGDKLKEIILFGSCARGDFTDESDVDVMVLLDVPSDQIPEERVKLRPKREELDEKYEYELLFATVVRSYDEYLRHHDASLFYKNVMGEGISYA
ncbi:MAG: nucleotidyltransferase domain-containing protein [Lachnospiraceae bacterium]|nr:nucleotidyltransferase domain-containing protein [Lachnospiraceae bacterium]